MLLACKIYFWVLIFVIFSKQGEMTKNWCIIVESIVVGWLIWWRV